MATQNFMDNENSKPSSDQEVEGVILEALPNTMFKVDIGNEKIVLVYLAGKMRVNRIKVMIGDRVRVVLDQYGQRGRIVRRI